MVAVWILRGTGIWPESWIRQIMAGRSMEGRAAEVTSNQPAEASGAATMA
jgi:hypothetical protein